MRKLIANEWLTLDGVVQAPSYPDEDASGGFAHGGWHIRYVDDRFMSWVIENVQGAGGFLLRMCKTAWFKNAPRYKWTSDGVAKYDIYADGKGTYTWNLRGSPEIY